MPILSLFNCKMKMGFVKWIFLLPGNRFFFQSVPVYKFLSVCYGSAYPVLKKAGFFVRPASGTCEAESTIFAVFKNLNL